MIMIDKLCNFIDIDKKELEEITLGQVTGVLFFAVCLCLLILVLYHSGIEIIVGL